MSTIVSTLNAQQTRPIIPTWPPSSARIPMKHRLAALHSASLYRPRIPRRYSGRSLRSVLRRERANHPRRRRGLGPFRCIAFGRIGGPVPISIANRVSQPDSRDDFPTSSRPRVGRCRRVRLWRWFWRERLGARPHTRRRFLRDWRSRYTARFPDRAAASTFFLTEGPGPRRRLQTASFG